MKTSQPTTFVTDPCLVIGALVGLSGLTVKSAICELIDNAMDAGARRVVVSYDRKKARFQVKDDGRGTETAGDIVTPFKRKQYATTRSGRYGFGGSAALAWLCGGNGESTAESITDSVISTAALDYAEVQRSNLLQGPTTADPNPGQPVGTTITVTHCIEITDKQLGDIRRKLSWLFSPALHDGASISFNIDGKATRWKAPERPRMSYLRKIDFRVDGHRIKGICGLVKPGQVNRVGGWAIAKAHRFMDDTFKEPLGERSADTGRIYSEVILPESWTNIDTLKNDFKYDPEELWAKLAKACEAVIDKAQQIGQTWELESSLKAAQSLLDEATGYAPPIKGRRPGTDDKEGTVEPTGDRPEHRQFTTSQPGDKPNPDRGRYGNRSVPSRIRLETASGMGIAWKARNERNFVRITLNRDSPANQLFLRPGQDGLIYQVLTIVAGEMVIRPDAYRAMFPDIVSESFAERFDMLCARLRVPTPLEIVA